MVYKLRDLIASANCGTRLPDGRLVRAMHEPFYGGYFNAAWEVFCGRAVAVRWPKSGELEEALAPERGVS